MVGNSKSATLMRDVTPSLRSLRPLGSSRVIDLRCRLVTIPRMKPLCLFGLVLVLLLGACGGKSSTDSVKKGTNNPPTKSLVATAPVIASTDVPAVVWAQLLEVRKDGLRGPKRASGIEDECGDDGNGTKAGEAPPPPTASIDLAIWPTSSRAWW